MKQEVSDYKTRKRELDYLIVEEVKVRAIKLWDIMIVKGHCHSPVRIVPQCKYFV